VTIEAEATSPRDYLRSAVDDTGSVMVKGLGDEAALVALAGDFGPLMEPGIAIQPGLHEGPVYYVRVRNGGAGVTNQQGKRILSSTNLPFSLHTDGYDLAAPPRYVFLVRLDHDDLSYPTFVSDVRSAIGRLPADQVRELRELRFPSARGPCLLIDRADSQDRLRINREAIEGRAGKGPNPTLSIRHIALLDSLSKELRQTRTAATLEPGDGLVLANWRIAHGRPELPPSSQRVLARIWVS
jgi:alpha-ketoglutarate-dependent taurine dioxygenase